MQRLSFSASGLSREEYTFFSSLSSPSEIQDFLDMLPMNHEETGDTLRSPREVLKAHKAHCIEGALVAATALWIHGEPPRIMNLSPRMGRGDFDHVVTLFKRGGYFGAVSKTNHAVLRYRDPVYTTLRELVLSYFHEWYLPKTGEKMLECYSNPLSLARFGTSWITSADNLWHIADALSELPHHYLVRGAHWRRMRKVSNFEREVLDEPEWPRS